MTAVFLRYSRLARHASLCKIAAGPRYTPELNIELPIAEQFDAVSKTVYFYNAIRAETGKLNQEFSRIQTSYHKSDLAMAYQEFSKLVSKFLSKIQELVGVKSIILLLMQ